MRRSTYATTESEKERDAIAYSQILTIVLRNVSFILACKRLSVVVRSLFAIL
ncbi:MAG: hypothetical protein V7K53_26085 [Nostoc sp.]|uniref:hypothetical protein n=1 Tax=Nostoc sp. TaxID=1180 RepID=UPI002FF4625F